MSDHREIAGNVVMAAPSVLNLLMQKVFGVTINEGLAVVSIIFICLQIGYLIWKWRREAAAARKIITVRDDE